MAVVISDLERAGLDILSHGDWHGDEHLAGRAWHHYPLPGPDAPPHWTHDAYPPGTEQLVLFSALDRCC